MRKTTPKPHRLTDVDWWAVGAILNRGADPIYVKDALSGMTKKGLVELRKCMRMAPGDFSKIALETYVRNTWEWSGPDEQQRCVRIVSAAGALFDMKPAAAQQIRPEPESDDSDDRDDEDEAMPQEPRTALNTPALPADAERAMRDLMRALSGSVNENRVREIVLETVPPTVAKAISAAADLLREELKREVRTVEIKREGAPLPENLGLQHKQFPELLRLIGARKPNGDRLSIWIWGPAGSGKTRAAREAAKALNLPFYIHGAAMSEHKYVGFIDAAGRTHDTGFRAAWTGGGVCLFDEADASSVEAFLAINAGLAGDYMDFPGEAAPVKRHADCVLIVCANTQGHGADRQYSGRMKQDGATLDRFVRLHWEIDETLERKLLPGFGDWVSRVQTVRAKAKARNLEVIISPRASENGAALIAAGFSPEQAADMTYLSGLRPEQRTALLAA